MKTCHDLGINVKAVNELQAHTLDGEFTSGTQVWIIGLMEIANTLQRDVIAPWTGSENEVRYDRNNPLKAPCNNRL